MKPRDTTQTAEQFLTTQGIKFRVVASAERGPGEWNVTFSRKGGGRLKLEFYQHDAPSLEQVLAEIVLWEPKPHNYRDRESDYFEDLAEFKHVNRFFTLNERSHMYGWRLIT